ncbi:TPA: hypothetical protein ACHTOO_002570 [Pseudomonas aeruginosa]|uniref:hypothetical protein n=1 Tax=Pseudomonas aeruginosa TaxID=287 RepID=UPI00304179AF|nr:hypothetical protein [Pseudomonas aeruginosa]
MTKAPSDSKPRVSSTPTPAELLETMVAWRVRGLPTDNKVTLEARIERRFRQSFGSTFYGVHVDQLEPAIDRLCNILATPEESMSHSACSRLNTIIARLVATVGHGASRSGPADVAALMSALELTRLKNAI